MTGGSGRAAVARNAPGPQPCVESRPLLSGTRPARQRSRARPRASAVSSCRTAMPLGRPVRDRHGAGAPGPDGAPGPAPAESGSRSAAMGGEGCYIRPDDGRAARGPAGGSHQGQGGPYRRPGAPAPACARCHASASWPCLPGIARRSPRGRRPLPPPLRRRAGCLPRPKSRSCTRGIPPHHSRFIFPAPGARPSMDAAGPRPWT